MAEYTFVPQQICEDVHALRVSAEVVQDPPPLLNVVPWIGAKRMDHLWENISVPHKEDLP